MKSITLLLEDKEINKLVASYQEYSLDKIPQYANYCFVVENCRITVYKSKKVLFQGKDAAIYASSFQKAEKVAIKKESKNFKELDKDYSMGSDEVGTGDYFGPVVVCAVYANSKEKEFLNGLDVNDSKKMTDAYILKIGPKLIQKLTHSLLILDNKKYNEIQKHNNMNAIKAKLHNQCYLHLIRKINKQPKGIVDQFTPENLYYRYLGDQKEVYRNLDFVTKAESKHIVVAAASVIARYSFLIAFNNLNKIYNFEFKKGANKQVDQQAAKFIEEFGLENLDKVAKVHFKNTEKALQLLHKK